jgi:polyadenylation factor subunit 2
MFDGGGGGTFGIGGGGTGGYSGGRRGGGQDVFDGKQLRKAVARRTVDYNSSAMRWFLDRAWQSELCIDVPTIQPNMESTVELVPPAAHQMDSNPITSACTKFVHSSMNKPGCPIHACKWTPEGKRLITGAKTGEFTLWHGLTFNFETILQAHETELRSIIWSHDENWMLSGDQNGVVKYWQSNMNNLKALQAHDQTIRDLTFARTDAKFASCSDDGTIKVWDFVSSNEERLLKGHGWDVRCVDWHPQYPILASGSKDSRVKIWDAKSGSSLTTLHGHNNTVVKVKWNENGNWLLTGSRDQLIKVYDVRTMREFQTFRGHRKEVTSMQWHPTHEGFFVSGGFDGAIHFWDVSLPDPVASVASAHQSSVWDLDWHPMGHILATSSNDQATKFWTRQRPGDQMNDKYSLQSEERVVDRFDRTSSRSDRGRHVSRGGSGLSSGGAAGGYGRRLDGDRYRRDY